MICIKLDRRNAVQEIDLELNLPTLIPLSIPFDRQPENPPVTFGQQLVTDPDDEPGHDAITVPERLVRRSRWGGVGRQNRA